MLYLDEDTIISFAPRLHANPPSLPDLYPTLIALSIALHHDEDLGSINWYHPDQQSHGFYKAGANAPKDISDLPPSAMIWKQI